MSFARALVLALALAPGAGCVELFGRRDDGDAPPARDDAPPSQEQRGGPTPQRTPPPEEPAANELRLDARWAPLEAIVERAALPGVSNTAATTIGTKVYVVDLQRWLKRHPQNSPLFEGVMLHEQVHSRRQLAAGVDPWIARYVRDTAFMWAEEQLGWYAELQLLKSRGLAINVKGVAKSLSNYSNLAGDMVTYDEALKWVEAVLAGRWKPPG